MLYVIQTLIHKHLNIKITYRNFSFSKLHKGVWKCKKLFNLFRFYLYNCSFTINYFNIKIKKPSDFYDWARDVLAPGFRAGKWYNNDAPAGLAGYTSDKNSRMIGYATLRQLRVKNSKL
jgi:hypothetical protein